MKSKRSAKKLHLKQSKNVVLKKSKKNRKGGSGEEVDKLSIELIMNDGVKLDLEVSKTDNIIPTIKKYLISKKYTLGNEDIIPYYEEFLIDPIVYFGEEPIEEIFLNFSESGIDDGARLNVKRIEEHDEMSINLRMKMDELIYYIVGIKEKQDRKTPQRIYFINLLSYLIQQTKHTLWCGRDNNFNCDDYIYLRLTTIFSEEGLYDLETKTNQLNDLMKKEMKLIFKVVLNPASLSYQDDMKKKLPKVTKLLTKILS